MDKNSLIVLGVVSGWAANYGWEKLELPGYGKSIVTVTDEVGIGWDDMAEFAIGIAIIYFVNRYFGIGFVIGILLSKLLEFNSSYRDWINKLNEV